MQKKIFREIEARDKMLLAVDKICLPVIETIGPLGRNVLYESDKGRYTLTNDGITIIRAIDSEDPIEGAIIDMVKGGSLRTNQEAGDGTSTTVLYTRNLVHKALDLQNQSLSHDSIRKMFERVLEKMLKRLSKLKLTVKDNKTKREIARISANNDDVIAGSVVETVDTAGLDGMVYIELNNGEKTTLEKQTGFRIPTGMIYQNLYSDVARPIVAYQNIPVIIFDKSLYYAEEAEHIVRVAINNGFKNIVIVAKDFLGDAPNTFIANHAKGDVRMVLAKMADETQIGDLAVYLGAEVISEAGGRRVDSITKKDFYVAKSVTADPQKILLSNVTESKELKERIKYLRSELEKNKDDSSIKNRLASLTNGIVTVKVGGRTIEEAREKVFRFEDSINALRAAMRDGYLVGGGLSIFEAFKTEDYDDEDECEVALSLAQASIIRIARNAQLKLDWKKIKKGVGLNARTGQYENLLESGVVEPYKAVEMSLKNAVSVACLITSIGTYILNDYEYDRDNNKGTDGRGDKD